VISDGVGGGETKWSGETIRRRGVRAVVDALRLNREHKQLSSLRAQHFEENRTLRISLQHLAALNGILRQFIRQHNGRGAFTQKTGNYWHDSFDLRK